MAFLTIARTRAIIRGTLSPANRAKRRVDDASRGAARVVSDVSVLCPRAVVRFDNYTSGRRQIPTSDVTGRCGATGYNREEAPKMTVTREEKELDARSREQERRSDGRPTRTRLRRGGRLR
jgi:hypothetical protein